MTYIKYYIVFIVFFASCTATSDTKHNNYIKDNYHLFTNTHFIKNYTDLEIRPVLLANEKNNELQKIFIDRFYFDG